MGFRPIPIPSAWIHALGIAKPALPPGKRAPGGPFRGPWGGISSAYRRVWGPGPPPGGLREGPGGVPPLREPLFGVSRGPPGEDPPGPPGPPPGEGLFRGYPPRRGGLGGHFGGRPPKTPSRTPKVGSRTPKSPPPGGDTPDRTPNPPSRRGDKPTRTPKPGVRLGDIPPKTPERSEKEVPFSAATNPGPKDEAKNPK